MFKIYYTTLLYTLKRLPVDLTIQSGRFRVKVDDLGPKWTFKKKQFESALLCPEDSASTLERPFTIGLVHYQDRPL